MGRYYQMPRIYCITRLTAVIASQQHRPMQIGRPPVLISWMRLVLRPMAAIASTMKNLLSSLTGLNTSALTPWEMATVVIMEAPIKYRMNMGKCF